MGIAILWTLAFYIVFAPTSLLLQGWLTNGVLIEDSTLILEHYLGWHTLIGTIICMILNLGLEYPFQRFIVFRNSIDQTEKKE